ncbi:hypothetical protein SAMN05443572_107333 [Myxococcus fulvus]|uniref:Lipoprotein n=1 Tax=Myxococcus fulvus TaxID=33 RepID=A0A511TDC4_MYXFU|nr:hypothetical protein [Myxococcus fulvus]GEN12174.1 hypothetical protein MFU01_72110 [Myxococcus fulvus]SEU26849.1 hypothetical protein SAMN05443572_107333 [Myxococcus fulvus]
MRALTLLLLSLLATACSAPQVRPPGAIRKVVVVIGTRVDSLPVATYREDMLGEGNPRSVLIGQTQAVLRERGFEVVGSRISDAPSPSTGEVVALIRENKAEAAVIVVLNWVDVSSIRAMGRAEVFLEAGLVSPDGNLLWRKDSRTVSSISMYQSQTDYSSYLRKAVIDAVQEVP